MSAASIAFTWTHLICGESATVTFLLRQVIMDHGLRLIDSLALPSPDRGLQVDTARRVTLIRSPTGTYTVVVFILSANTLLGLSKHAITSCRTGAFGR